MPQISKARIVNFYYNNGHRFIPDLTFSFERDDRSAMDTLISLTNGGGKSVIVQLLLQPILPRQKLNQRRLESYFTRPTDHSFVLLEWKLDDSTDHLLTGIAISGRGEEDENQRGRSVRYYTFCKRYGFRGDPEDVVNLPLFTRKGREFQAEPFEFVKEQAKKRSSGLQCFREDRQTEYRKLLEGYRISIDEWRNVIAVINQREGGLSDYFDSYRNSSRLIDGVLLPCVEKKLNAGASEGEDSSLESLLLHFAQDYHAAEDKVRLRNLAQELETELNQCREEVEPLYHKADLCEATARQMRGFARSLERLETENRSRQDWCDRALAECDGKERRIALERRSDEYHRALEARKQAEAAMEDARQELEQSEKTTSEQKHRVTRLECAKLLGQIREQEGVLLALREQKRVLEGDSDRAETLNQLRYTVWSLASQRLSETRERLDALEQSKARYDAVRDRLQQQEKAQIQQYERAKRRENQLQGAVDNQKSVLADMAEALNTQLDFRLDGSLEEEPVRRCLHSAQQEREDCLSRQEQGQIELHTLEERLDRLREEQSEQREQLHVLVGEREQSEETLNRYRLQEEDLQALFRRQEMDFSQRFNARPGQELRHRLEEKRGQRHEFIQKRELVRRQMEAVAQGTVHVPDEVLRYLRSRRVSFQTCEEYLRSWPKERVTELLERCPVCAYGILLAPEERQTLLSEKGTDWLPAAVPLFSYDELAAMLSGTYQSGMQTLACYSEEYFHAPEQFQVRLEGRERELTQEELCLRDVAEQMEADLRTVERFDYSEQYAAQLRERLLQLEQGIAEREKTLSQLTEERETALKKREERNALLHRLREEQSALELRISQLAALEKRAAEYARQLDALLTAAAEAERSDKALRQTRRELAQCRAGLEELSGQLRTCSAQAEEAQSVCARTAGAKAAEPVESDLNTLCAQLERLEQEQDSSQKRLNEEIERSSKLLKGFRSDLKRKKLSPPDYEDLRYSEQAMDEAEERYRLAEAQLREKQTRFRTLELDCSNKAVVLEERRKAVPGEPLPPDEIHYQFEQRERELAEQRKRIHREQSEAHSTERQIASIQERCREYDQRFSEQESAELTLEQDFVAQWRALCASYEETERQRETMHKQFRQRLRGNQERFGADADFQRMFRNGLEMLDGGGGTRSGRYYTLYSQMFHNIDMARRLIESLNTQIGMLDTRREEMEKQFFLQGKRLYDSLKKLAESTRVRLEGKKASIPMLQINLPGEVELHLAQQRISHELGQGLDALLECLKRESHTADELMRQVRALCRSRRLLNCYTGQDELEVKVYKVDYNRRNSQYRTWSDTMVDNSGAEKFVSCFAVLVAMLNYSRTDGFGTQCRKESSVLILDNPFGAITSAHLLKPMFQIAAAFRVQMVCLSDISKCDVTECFDSVIKAAVKKNALSNLELLEAEETEQVERAFFRAEQFSLL